MYSGLVLGHWSCDEWCSLHPTWLLRNGLLLNFSPSKAHGICGVPGFAACSKHWLRMTVSHFTLAWSCLLYFSLPTRKCQMRLILPAHPPVVCSARPDTQEKHGFLQANKPTGDQSSEGLLGSGQREKANAGWLRSEPNMVITA